MRLGALLCLLLLAACESKEVDPREEGVAAEVFGKKLLLQDVHDQISGPLSKQDSITLVSALIDRWVRKEIYLHEAEKMVSEEIQIDKLVQDYKESLIIHHFENSSEMVSVDTSIDEAELHAVFQEKSEMYLLQDPIYEVQRFICSTLDKEAIYALEDQVSSEELPMENLPSDVASMDTLWLAKVALPIDSVEYKKGSTFVTTQNGAVCIIKILSVIGQNEVPPFSYVRKEVRKYVLQRRRQEAIRALQDELYEKAISQNLVKVYLQ